VSSTQLYTGDPARLAAARTSAPPPPAARAPGHLRSDGRRAGERQPGTRPGGTCANRAEVRSRRRALRQPVAATRHARGRSARRPAPSVGAPAADHAAALWQLCCAALVTTTTVACPVIGSRARCHRVQMATMAERGANAGTARRARDVAEEVLVPHLPRHAAVRVVEHGARAERGERRVGSHFSSHVGLGVQHTSLQGRVFSSSPRTHR
jgi:hypothetical protein